MNVIEYENLRNFAYSNDRIVKQPIRGLVLSFFGLGCMDMYSDDPEAGKFFTEKGILYLVPYNNPWAWMNRQAVAYTDALVTCLLRRYTLPDDLPIISTGGSMGGQSALVYMVYAQRTPIACVANCPVCDMPFHYTERPDLPRTLYSAFFNEPGSMDDALRAVSPLDLVDKMPDAAYYIFHCEADQAVNQAKHSDRFVEKMRPGHRVVYHSVPGRGHCDLPDDMRRLYLQYAADAIEGACVK